MPLRRVAPNKGFPLRCPGQLSHIINDDRCPGSGRRPFYIGGNNEHKRTITRKTAAVRSPATAVDPPAPAARAARSISPPGCCKSTYPSALQHRRRSAALLAGGTAAHQGGILSTAGTSGSAARGWPGDSRSVAATSHARGRWITSPSFIFM